MNDKTTDLIRQAIQEVLNSEEEGWMVQHYAAAVGLVKVNPGGGLDTSTTLYFEEDQADYITEALLDRGVMHLHYAMSEDVEDD